VPQATSFDRGWSVSSYRSGTSVDTSLGSETDDSEYTQSSSWNKRSKKHLLPHVDNMPALPEESSDEDSLGKREKERTSENRKDSDITDEVYVDGGNLAKTSTAVISFAPEERAGLSLEHESSGGERGSKLKEYEFMTERQTMEPREVPQAMPTPTFASQIKKLSKPRETPYRHIERGLRTAFSRALDVDVKTITRYSNFFRYGGNSLAALTLVQEAREHGVYIMLSDVFQYPILRDMAEIAFKTLSNVDKSFRPESESHQGDSDGMSADQSSGRANEESPPAVANPEGSGSDTKDREPAHLFPTYTGLTKVDWKKVQTQLPESWMWDVDYHNTSTSSENAPIGCWTCTPIDNDIPKSFPLTIAGMPVVLPVEHTWPPMSGVNPPPDPRPSAPIDCMTALPLEVIRDLFLTFAGGLGFYVLLNGVLQIIVDEEFNMEWATSHLPHKYGGLKICYIRQTMEPTMTPTTGMLVSKTETIKSRSSQLSSAQSSLSGQSSTNSFFRPSSGRHPSLLVSQLQLNDFIEARAKSSHKKDKFAGRIGARVMKNGEPYLVMSSHVITDAILAKSHRPTIFGRNRDRVEKLDGDWNEQVEIWAGNEKVRVSFP